jgi:hypothetical protein
MDNVYEARCQEYGNPEDAARVMVANPNIPEGAHRKMGEASCVVFPTFWVSKAVPFELMSAEVTVRM